MNETTLTIFYLNIRGQTKFYDDKQQQLQDLIMHYGCDIIHLQETDFNDDTFKNCSFIKSNYQVISNNSATGYGTASLVKNDLDAENIRCDTEGRIIVFDIKNITFCNLYIEAGTDGCSRTSREAYFSEAIPNLLIGQHQTGYAGGDWNCIIEKKDATYNAISKMSPGLSRLCKTFEWQDSHRLLHPNSDDYSHFYTVGDIFGATRIDRQYHWGYANVVKSQYIPSSFSDHFGLITKIKLPFKLHFKYIPRHPPSCKISNEVARDPFFQNEVTESMVEWRKILSQGLDELTWWELVVKPGLRNIGVKRKRELRKEHRGKLNLLLIRQAYLVKKLEQSYTRNIQVYTDLKQVQKKVNDWYSRESKKIQDQCRKDEFLSAETTRIYHHNLHRKNIKQCSILSLDTEEGYIEGHKKCSEYLERKVRDLIGRPAVLDLHSQQTPLDITPKVYTDDDNYMLEKLPSKQELYTTLTLSNLNASAGTDGITALVYKECWKDLGDCLLDICTAIFLGSNPTTSMRTAKMNFCPKPKKPNSRKPSDKRRISVLNCDFKLYEGLIARRFRKLGSRTLSHLQYVAGGNRLIHHGIARARDAIAIANIRNLRCGIGDQDYIAAFDYLVLSWVWKVLEKKGVRSSTLDRLRNFYSNGITIPVVNSLPGKAINDARGSLRQGGVGSMEWFAVGIDPLLIFLDLNLSGIPISSLPVLGPSEENCQYPLPPIEERFKAVAYCNDVKPAICSFEEFLTADYGATLFEKAAGTRLHRDPSSEKCKFLPLGKWKRELHQELIPTPYMRLTDNLDMVGVQLCSSWASTRKKNGDLLREKVSTMMGM